jgi:iron complex outermembrane receptor protein
MAENKLMNRSRSISSCLALLYVASSPALLAAELEEIQVTATKTSQSIQDIPIAVSAFTAQGLDRRGISETTDLSGLVPSLVVISPFGRTQPNFSLRGISVANEFNPNAASPIGIYVNEDYKQFRSTHGMQLFDLDRIEVIRGPQGTLFGRNTTGGAISIFTKKPGYGEVGEFTGYVTGSYGNYDRWTLEGAVETTLIEDVLSMRLAATRTEGDGYIENVTPDKVQSLPELLLGLPPNTDTNALTDEDYASLDERALRATFALTPFEGFEAILVATFGESNPVAPVPIVREFGPPDAVGNYANVFGYNREQFGAYDDDEAVSDSTGKSTSDADDYTLTLNWDLADNLRLTSISGYTDGELDIPHDCDGHPVATCYVNFTAEFDQFNQDLRLAWTGENSTLIAGVYYGEDQIDTRNNEVFFGPLAGFAGFPTAAIGGLAPIIPLAADIYEALLDAELDAFPVFNPPVDSYILSPPDGLGAFQGDPDVLAQGFRAASQFTQERESFAIYAEGTYDFGERWSVTAGLRYTDDSITLSDLRSTFFDLITDTPQYNAIPLNAVPDQNQVLPDLKDDSEEVTGRAILEYRFSDDLMTYGSYSRGYRAGTFNGKASQSVSQVSYVEPEFVDNYELGLKSQLFDGQVRLNAALFYADYTDQQVQEIVGATSFLRNASGEMLGLELELETYLTDALYIGASFGYLDSEYDSGEIVNGIDIGGNQFPFAPEVSASLFGNWEIVQLGDGVLELNGVVRYQDLTWFDPFNDLKTKNNGPGKSGQYQNDYTLVDARLVYRTDRYELALWGRNLTDEFYYVSGFDTSAFLADDLTRGEPRTYGLEARVNF